MSVRIWRVGFGVLGLLVLATSAAARPQEEDDGDVVVMGPNGPIAASGGAPQASAAPKSPRAQRLAQLKYDRRPSVILAARSKPAGETAPAAKAEGAGAQEPADGGEAADEEAPGAVVSSVTYSAGGAVAVMRVVAPRAVAPSATPPVAEEAAEEAPSANAEAAAAAAEAAKVKSAEAAAAAKALDAELAALQRNVTLGDWEAVRSYLAGLTPDEAKVGYERLLASLVEGPPRPQSQFAQWSERNAFAAEDIVGLVRAAPAALERARLAQLGTLLRQCVDNGGMIETCLAHLRAALADGTLTCERRDVAAILIAANDPLQAGEFLPPLEEARAKDDRVALNLYARHCLARHDKEKKGGFLEEAWKALMAVLASGTVTDEDKNEALTRAVEVAPRIRAELGGAWLAESFGARPERGLEILAAIGSAGAKGMVDRARDPNYRLKSLELARTATESLLRTAPERAASWSDTLTLLAANWLHEAEYSYQNDTTTHRGPGVQRDSYGNIFYMDWNGMRSNPNQPLALKCSELLEQRPSDEWLAHVADGLAPRIERALAQLLLKVGDEDGAFPHIERLAALQPEPAKDLAEEFLRVWITNHDPNEQKERTNPYMFMYGFEERANGVPLTRSKQERNLVELAQWITRLKALPIKELDQELVARAFTAAHSSAEVFRVETIERVFGALGGLGPKTLAELVQTMRANLAEQWRDPAKQDEKKTRRRQRDIQSEVLRGYEVAHSVVERGLADHPDDWALTLAQAAVLHDENDYRQELTPSPEFAARRLAAFAGFQRAADLYRAQLSTLDVEEETTRVYELWFYAALGACDLAAIDAKKVPAEAQFPLVRAAIEALPGEAAARHADLFANALFTRLSNVAPAVKAGYVRHGLEVAPMSPRAKEVRELGAYYDDLVTEIRLDAHLDGSARVGAAPFGLFVDLRHTAEIEREAGGFGKYLVNQNAQNFAWNYGRPTEDYRDKFEQAARAALEEHFEVLSVTFNHPEAHSRALAEYGWRVTPYAYLLLKARGPEVDKLPALRFDLDFLDTSGYAILPIASPPIPLDASASDPEGRPFRGLKITQTLDERQAKDKKLILEVQAHAFGLVPELEELLTLDSPGFTLAAKEDQGVSVNKFDDEGEGKEILSDRTWQLTLKAADDLAELPTEFHFGVAKDEGATLEYQRFADADLVTAESVVKLDAHYGERRERALWPWLVGLVLAGGLGFAGYRAYEARRRAARPSARFRMPETLSPFTVLGLLRAIEAHDGLASAERSELRAAIEELEGCYFAEREGAEPDLEALAAEWLARAS